MLLQCSNGSVSCLFQPAQENFGEQDFHVDRSRRCAFRFRCDGRFRGGIAYETTGLPISAVQLRVLGAANVQQQLPAATSTVTPVQLSVLTPRKKLKTATVAPGQTETGRATR
jgi:hypothetical protein